ncbi:MAG: T9SS type A sorting domain-containing protein [candidate division WOR-3 bacterium]
MGRAKVSITVFIFLNFSWAIWDVRVNNIGQWEVCISNYGKFGETIFVNAGAWWPRGSGHNYIFGAGIWIGAIAPNGDTLVTVGYNPSNAVTEFAPGLPYSNPENSQWRVYFSTELGYPFVPVSVEDCYAVYNDFNQDFHIPNDTRPIGITVTLRTLAFPKDWADDILFLKYIIKNDTTHTINNLYAGIGMDYDIGNEAWPNDRGGIDLTRKLFFGWQNQPEPGWDSRGMIGLKLLSPYSLSCFKRFTLNSEPNLDWQRYMAMAGYNFQNGNYEPFDTIWFPPDDQRILMSTGIWNLSPGDSIILDWALIASHDTLPPSPEMEYKADKAQTLFNIGFHNVHISQPNGEEIISGNYPIIYTANSITPNPLSLDFYLVSEHGFDTIALGQLNNGIYSWNTTLFPDGVLYRVIALAYDTITLGGDISDSPFVIDNPGNAPPYLKVLSPKTYLYLNQIDTLSRDFDIAWFTRDPEFLDSLYINIYFKSEYDSIFEPIATNEPNDSHYIWNTLPIRNGLGWLVLETHDEEFTVAETVSVYLLNQISGGPLNHIQGLNNCVDLSCLVHQLENLTGHTYELEFLQYKRIQTDSFVNYPEYIYKITDLNTGQVVLDTYSLKDAYYHDNGVGFNDYSPITDGFSIRAYTVAPNIIYQQNFHNDSVKIISGSYPEDSISLFWPSSSTWWAYRGSRLQLDWVIKAGGGLTLLVTDLDYGDTIPYKPYSTIQNPDSAFGWCFRNSIIGGSSSDTLRPGYDRYIFFCGSRIYMSASGVFPQVGDRWIVYPSQNSPPIKGNVYRFTPVNYIAETKSQLKPFSFQILPVPSRNNLTIAYSLPKVQKISLAIYDVLGRQVKRLRDGIEKPGDYKIFWNGFDDNNRKVSSGVYFCRFETEGLCLTKKVVLLR